LLAVSYVLTTDDKQNIKIFALKYRHNITNFLYADLCEQFKNNLSILTTLRDMKLMYNFFLNKKQIVINVSYHHINHHKKLHVLCTGK